MYKSIGGIAMKVFINQRHAPNGNPDPGACGNGLRESDITAAVGALVDKYLQAAEVETNLLQSDSLGEISATLNAWGADMFVSIHCNSAGNPAVNGTETHIYPGSVKGTKLVEYPRILFLCRIFMQPKCSVLAACGIHKIKYFFNKCDTLSKESDPSGWI